MTNIARPAFTKAEDDYLREHYHADGAEQCGLVLGRPTRGVASRAQKIGLTKIDRPLTIRILDLAARPMKGCRSVDVDDEAHNTAREFGRLVLQHRLYRCKVSYRDVRYFTTPELAAQLRASRELVITKSEHRGVTIRSHRASEGWQAGAAMHCRCGGELGAGLKCRRCGGKPTITYGASPKVSYHTNTHSEVG